MTSTIDTPQGVTAPAQYPGHGTKPYRAYVLGMLFTIYGINLLDRGLVGLLQEPIKREFGLSDFQLGLLGGPTFALFYTFMGLPIARWAEHHSRVLIVSICTALWSAMTMLCGVAVNFPMLLAARLGVGVGEAGCVPPSQSVVADYFPADKRASAISIYLMAIPIGGVVGSVIGGIVGQEFGWRMAFIVLGAPGLVIALVTALTVKEPPRVGTAEAPPNFTAALREVAGKASFWHVAVATGLCNFVAVGNGQYSSSFMMRVHHLTLTEVGLITGPIVGGVSALSVFIVGKIINHLTEKDRAWLARWPGIGLLVYVPVMIAAYLAPNLYVMLGLQIVGTICGNAYLIALYTMAQGVVAPRMRATATALVMMVISLLGYGLGPPLIGALSDFMQSHAVQFGLALDAATAKGQGLRYALAIGCLVNLWAAAHYLIGSTKLRKDWVG